MKTYKKYAKTNTKQKKEKVSVHKFHKKDWEFLHRGKHDESLCKKIQDLAEAVDFQHAKHKFFSAFLHVQDQVKDHCDRILHHKETRWSKFLKRFKKKFAKKRRKHVRQVTAHVAKRKVEKTLNKTKEKVFEVMHMDDIIDRAVHLAEKKRLVKEKVQEASERTADFGKEQILEPVKDVVNVESLTSLLHRVGTALQKSWYKLKVGMHSSVKPTLSMLRVTAVFALIFTGTFVVINLEAMTTVGGHYLKNNTFLADYFQQKEAAEQYISEESLAPAPKDLVLAEEERQANEEKKLELLPLNIEVTPDDNRLYIPRIDKDIPIQNVANEKVIYSDRPQDIEDAIQEALKDGVVRYPGTAKPGEQGNVALTGHSSFYLLAPGKYKDVFALLHTVQMDDEIIIYYGDKKGDQDKHVYKVTEIKEVKPHEVDILKQTNDYRLTLITCTPIGTTLRRLVITAIQVE